jgi:nucleotide-binding universal stress UspA family protein
MARGRAILDDAEAIVAAAGVPVTTSLRRGDLVEALAEREAEAGMILIGRRGEAADYAPGHLGSNLERVARAARRPVLVASEAFRPIGRVLVAHDGGPGGARVAGSPLYRGLAVTVATAGTATPAVAQALDAAEARLAAAGIAAETRIVPGEPEAALAELATAGGFDLAVLGAQGPARVRSLVLGSTTTELVRALAIPVVLVRGA